MSIGKSTSSKSVDPAGSASGSGRTAARLWRLSVVIAPEAEDAVMEMLHRIIGAAPCAYLNLKSGLSTVSVYLGSTSFSKQTLKVLLQRELEELRRLEIPLGPARIRLSHIQRENWAESWKQHFKPFEIGKSLLVKPGWSRLRPRAGQAVVVIDPGLSFGTGHHPTTAFCLEQLAAARQTAQRQSFLDIGTGSGILAVAAAKLGYSPVHAFDFDPEATRIAARNARANHVGKKIRIEQRDLTKQPCESSMRYSVVCSNLITPMLLKEHRQITSRVAAGGLLVLAGILRSEFSGLRKLYEKAGFALETSKAEKEWRSGAFRSQG